MSDINESKNNPDYEYITEEKDGKTVRTRVRKKVRYVVEREHAHSKGHGRRRSIGNKKHKRDFLGRLFVNKNEREAGMPLLWLAIILMIVAIPILIVVFDFFSGVLSVGR